MKFKYKLLIVVAPAVFILDRLTKLAILDYLEVGERIPIVSGFFDLVHFRNTGAAFGLFSAVGDAIRVPFFYAVAIVAVILLAWFYRSLGDREILMPVALSLVFGGIAGNISDRIALGSVVDFLSFHIGDRVLEFSVLGKSFNIQLEWPAFNCADSAITVAMFLIIWSALRKKKGADK